MKPLYVKKNGVVYKISGNGMPALYPAENVEYDNTVTSELQATDVQGAIDELSTRQGGVQSDWDEDDTTELDYIKNKPQNLVQDASYVHTDNNYDATAKGKVDALGTAASKNVPASGNASTTEVVMGDDTRLTDARSASDVSAWAKASTKPTYTASEVGAIASTLKGSVNGVAELDAAGKVPSSQLPSFVDDVIEVADYDHLPITGESGKIYVTLDTNKTYRWTGSGYAEISESLALGETSSTAYRGDRGKTAYDHATETKLSTATASGLYKVAATAQGHISSLTPVQKSDITALGIPGSDTDTKNTAYGTCDTAGDVKDKVATLVNATNWSLEVGTIVGVRFTYTNTCSLSGISLNVNNTGAKNIRYSDGILTSGTDPKCPTAFGEAGQTIYYMYDGTYWVWVSHSKDNDTTYAFEGNTFRSEDGSNYYHGDGTNGNANNMTTNGHYYYKSNGPSTAIGAYGTDGAMFVQAYDSDNVAQIAQNYENGNLFVRGKTNGSWTDWKKPIANITGNNAVLTTDKTPFLTRQTLNPTGFSGYVREKLVGASYAWNQLNDQTYYRTSANTTVTANAKNGFDASSTAQYIQPQVIYGGGGLAPVYAGHKYLIAFGIEDISHISSGQLIAYGTTLTRLYYAPQKQNHLLIAPSVNGNQQFGFEMQFTMDAANRSIVVTNLICVDLTLAFGSTIADRLYSLTNNGGITKLRDMGCPIDKYTSYGYGLYSVKTSGKLIRGFNLWDEQTEIGGINSDGTNNNSVTNSLRSKNFCTIVGGLNYYISCQTISVANLVTYFYDGGKNLVPYTGTGAYQNGYNGSGAFTAPTGAKYFRIRGTSTYGTVYQNDICINISDTNKNGQYAPYSSTTYPLGNDELRGKFDLVNGEIVASGDVKESNGEIDRNYKLIDLGSVEWMYLGSGDNVRFLTQSAISDIKAPSNNEVPKAVCANYTVMAYTPAFSTNKSFAIYSDGKLFVKDFSYTDATTFKNAMNGVYAIVELATPTTEQSTPFADPMSMIGATTEEYIDTRDIPCPVGAERQYMGQSEDVVEIPSSPLSDGKRVLISEVSGGKEQVYWDIPKLYYKEYTVQGDGTTTWGDLLAELKPYYETLSEDEKTYSKLIFRPESISGNECLSYCGAYWYSRMGLNSNRTLWIDHASLGPTSSLIYYYQKNGDTFIDKTSETTRYSLSLRVFVEVGNNS